MVDGLELRQLVPDHEIEEEMLPSTRDNNAKLQKYPYIGILLAALSSLFFSLCSVIVKWMVHVNPMELAVCRFVGVLLPVIPIIILKQETVFPAGKRVMLLLRSFLGTTGLMLSFYAFRLMPLADASVIVFSVPVFVAIFAYVFLKEPCGLFNIVTIVLTLLGIILITRPSFIFGHSLPALAPNDEKNDSALGAIAAFGATLFSANVYVLLRALKSLHFAVLMANFGAFALVQTTSVTWYLGGFCWPKCGLERLLMVALAIFSFIGQILLTLALQFEHAGPVSIARSSDIVFAFIWQVWFFKETPNAFSLAGAFLVTSSVIIVGLRKWVLSLPDNTPLKLKLHLLTK